VEAGGESALQVAEDPLDHREVRLAGIMHEEAHLLDGVCQVRTRQREVLERASKVPVCGRISNRSTVGCG